MKKTGIVLLGICLLLASLCGCSVGVIVPADEPVHAGQLLRSVLALTCTVEDTNGEAFATSSGSAVIIDLTENGGAYVLTNYHVVYDQNGDGPVCRSITAAPYGLEAGDGLPATYVWHASAYDIAVLYVADLTARFPGASAVSLDAAGPAMGEEIFAVGNMQGQGICVRRGIVSREWESVRLPVSYQFADIGMGLIRFDAAVNVGDSGGALFTEDGAFAGLINARRLDGGGGYAIPASFLRVPLEEVLATVATSPTADVLTLGAGLREEGLRTVYEEKTGALVTEYAVCVEEVAVGSVASVFLQKGDVLLSVSRNGEGRTGIDRLQTLEELLLAVCEGDELTWQYRRDGEEKTYVFTVSAAHIEIIK